MRTSGAWGARMGKKLRKLLRNLSQTACGLLVIAAIFNVIRSPALIELLKSMAIGALKLIGAFAAAASAMGLLYYLGKKAHGKDDGREQAIEFVSRYIPLKFAASLPDAVFRPKKQMQELKARRAAWLSAILLLLTSVAASTGIEKLVDLPPTELSAAATIYQVAEQVYLPGKREFMQIFQDVLQRINVSADKRQKSPVSDKLFKDILPVRWRLQLESEIYSSLIYPGLSVLNLYLEWTYGIRTVKDLPPFEPNSAEERALDDILKNWQPTRLRDKLLTDATLMIWPLLFALVFWAGKRQISLRIAVGASFYLFSALILIYEFVYIVAATVVILAVAELLAWMAWLLVLEIWLLGILPELLSLSLKRCALAGHVGILLVQIINLLASHWIFGIGA